MPDVTRGRPLQFLGSVLAGWAGLRIVMLLPADVTTAPVIAPALAAAPQAAASGRAMSSGETRPAKLPAQNEQPAEPASVISDRGSAAPEVAVAASTTPSTGRPAAALPPAAPMSETSTIGDFITSPIVALTRDARSRLAVDAWLVARPGGGDSLAFGQLGASQGGARATYALDRHVAVSGRLSAPFRGTGREAGIGIDLRPTRLPVHLLVEQRVGLDGGGTRPAVAVIAGVSAALPGRARLDIYAQGGAVWRRGGFVDGAAVVTRSVFRRGGTRLELGGGAWGAAQRQVARLDLGPSVALAAPAGDIALRLQLDYRARVTGRARPGSGPALTLGGSF